METQSLSGLNANLTASSQVKTLGRRSCRLEIAAGPAGRYRVAQLDDYCGLPRRAFPWQPPFRLSLEARASAQDIPGTWGFGLWNDPFGMALIGGKRGLYLPALPNAAWFFFASKSNYLSVQDDLPACGALAATFLSPRWPAALFAPAILGLPLLFWPAAIRRLRRLARRFIHQDAAALSNDPRQWHIYEIEWLAGEVRFRIDHEIVLSTPISPNGPLGLVIWIDNQYAALPPTGRIAYGTLASPEPAWIELREVSYG